jgi:transcriptional regulator
MYVPRHFAAGEAETRELLSHCETADLITATPQGLLATFLPVLYDPDAGDGEGGALLAHVARNNDQWREPVLGEALAILRGPDAYVSPAWYASKAEHGRVVPTWNYVTAHVYGRLVVHEDPEWLASMVHRLTERHESGRARPWSVDDAPAAFVAGQLRAIVGLELVITRVEAKVKLSQNRSEADRAGVAEGLAAEGDTAMAAAVRDAGHGGRRRARPEPGGAPP